MGLPVVSKEEIDTAIKWLKIPASLRRKFREAFQTGSRKKAIEMHCVSECQGSDPGYREAIHSCSRRICPLWRFRPYQNLKKKESEE